jgi:hypothetical protein
MNWSSSPFFHWAQPACGRCPFFKILGLPRGLCQRSCAVKQTVSTKGNKACRLEAKTKCRAPSKMSYHRTTLLPNSGKPVSRCISVVPPRVQSCARIKFTPLLPICNCYRQPAVAISNWGCMSAILWPQSLPFVLGTAL